MFQFQVESIVLKTSKRNTMLLNKTDNLRGKSHGFINIIPDNKKHLLQESRLPDLEHVEIMNKKFTK